MSNISDSNTLLFSSRIEIKPLSVNKCWQGKRFKTTDYENYEKELLYRLPAFNFHNSTDPLTVCFLIGVSNLAFDVDNALKPLLDVMQKKYNFNDRYIFRLVVDKVLVRKGLEFIEFNIKKYKPVVQLFGNSEE